MGLVREVQKFGRARKGIRNRARVDGLLLGVWRQLSCRQDEASAHGVKHLLGDGVAGGVEGGKAHAVGMRGGRHGVRRVHLVTVKEKIRGLRKAQRSVAAELKCVIVADGGERSFNGGGIHGIGRVTAEAQENGAVGAVPNTRMGEGTIQFCADRSDGRQWV